MEKILLKEVLEKEALEVAKYLVGLDQGTEDFQDQIMKHNQSNATNIVGIVGMGGVGKSTLAKHLYNLKHHDFSRSRILYGVRNKGFLSLQKKIFCDLLGSYDLQYISSVSQGICLCKIAYHFYPSFDRSAICFQPCTRQIYHTQYLPFHFIVVLLSCGQVARVRFLLQFSHRERFEVVRKEVAK